MTALQDQLKDLPHRFLEKIIARKLKEAGIEDSIINDAAKKLASHIVSGNHDTLKIEDGRPERPPITISFGDEEVEEIKSKSLEFIASELPGIIENVAETSGASLVANLKAKWPQQAEYDDALIAGFMSNLDARWGAAISYLKIILTISRELGAERVTRIKRRKKVKDPSRQEVLWRLHARGCQVTEEIIILLENGLADGAMARWRTLHEIDVVSSIIAANDEVLARRYIDHQIVESKIDGGIRSGSHRSVSRR